MKIHSRSHAEKGNIQKSVIHIQSCCFGHFSANTKQLARPTGLDTPTGEPDTAPLARSTPKRFPFATPAQVWNKSPPVQDLQHKDSLVPELNDSGISLEGKLIIAVLLPNKVGQLFTLDDTLLSQRFSSLGCITGCRQIQCCEDVQMQNL